LIDVLLLRRHMPRPDVVAGLETAVSVVTSNADVVAVEARKHQHGVTRTDSPDAHGDVLVDGARVSAKVY
jgi:hypothetical protein